jgi:arylsulfatase A-like enzyme
MEADTMSKWSGAWWACVAACACVTACDSGEKPGAEGAGAAARLAAPVAEGAAEPEANGEATPKDAPSTEAAGGVVFSMVDNRHMAHARDGGALVIHAGEASGLKYVQGRWKNPWFDAQEEDGVRFAHARGPGATLRFPLGRPGDTGAVGEGWRVQARLRPVGDQRCDVFLKVPGKDEQKIGSLGLKPGWSEYDVALPADAPRGQEVALRFHFSRSRDVPGVGKSAAAFDWLRVGEVADGAPAPPELGAMVDAKAKKITLGSGRSLTWFTALAPGSRFVAQVDGEAELVARGDGAKEQVFALSGAASVDLSKVASDATSLELRAKGDGEAVLTAPGIARAEPAAKEAKGPRVVVVWLIDTLRADHLSAYNPKTDVKTPNLDAFAKEAAVFTRASVQGNSSLPSSASIFSSMYPSAHGVVTQSAKLPKDATMFGEAMASTGARAGLFSSNGYVSNSWGFARGFAKEHNPIRAGGRSEAEHLWGEAKEWMKAELEKDADARLFVYLNTSDPHVPYDPPADDLALYHSGGGKGRVSPRGTGELLHELAGGKLELNAGEHAYMRALYKGEITYNDRIFGQMLADLKELGVRDEAMIAVTSDHGEEFGEYGRYGHGISANQELVDVPLIIGFGGWTAGGRRVERAVELLDLFPTLAAAFGAKLPEGLQGEDLGAAARGEEAWHPTPSIAYHNDFLRSARVGDLKYQLFQGDNDPVYELKYGETGAKMTAIDGEDVSGKRPVARRMMRDLMAFHLARDTAWRKSTDGHANNHSAALASAWDGGW